MPDMTEKFSVGRCRRCGAPLCFEDGIRQDFCECDPRCESCGRQFVPGFSPLACDECVEEEVAREFSEEFLRALGREQWRLLCKEIARRFEE
jgi:hypothetical protein